MLKKEKRILNPPQGVNEVVIFEENLEFMVFVYICDEWEKQQIEYLNNFINNNRMTTEDICKWCIHHKIKCQLIYLVSAYDIVRHPFRYYRYIRSREFLRDNGVS